jgi:hypothetical protein
MVEWNNFNLVTALAVKPAKRGFGWLLYSGDLDCSRFQEKAELQGCTAIVIEEMCWGK